MNADEWPEQAQNTYNLELSKADNHRNLESSETWADLICEGDLYNDECINLHITLNNRKRQCFINNFLRNMTKHRLHNPNFPEPNHITCFLGECRFYSRIYILSMVEKIYVPKGKNILTKNGCTCKNEYKTNTGKTIKNGCTNEGSITPWCVVEGRCGAQGASKTRWYDRCSATSETPVKVIYGKDYFYQNLKGIILYIVVFVVAIPIILYRYGFTEVLEVYMPNFDLLATAVSFGGGPSNSRIFQELYNTDSENILGQTSTLMINYLSLLGLTYLVARRVNITNSLAKGWG